MKISAINSAYTYKQNGFGNKKKVDNGVQKTLDLRYLGVPGESLIMEGHADEYFKLVDNLSSEKLGSKFILESRLPEYKDLRFLVTPDTVIESKDKNKPFKISVKKEKFNYTSFKGRLYGSIRQDADGKIDYKMQDEYIRFWTEGMYNAVQPKYHIYSVKNDYNFFIPSDGDGTRYKDITRLQGDVTKPASDIPATLNGKQMSLIQGVIANFALTNKLDKMFDFVRVKPAQGSAFAFLEGLKSGKVPTNKPIVFSWGDNFSDIDVSRLMQEHERNGSAFTVTVIPVEKNQTKSLSIIKPLSMHDKTISEFVEKPQDDEFIESCAVEINGETKYLSAVGPYIISPQALEWIKSNYISNPEAFKSSDKGYDFSSMIIAPILKALNNGEIYNDRLDLPMNMHFEVVHDTETWSDLGSQKDFSKAMKSIKDDSGKMYYGGLPYEMRTSIKDNVDYKGNITFNPKSRKLFDDMTSKLNIDARNVIAYCKDEGLSYNRF